VRHSFAFDLDGTLTRCEILPEIARELGVHDEMAELTRRTMDGEVPFEASFRRRVEMLRDVPISRVAAIVDRVPLDPHLSEFVRANRDRCWIVTGNLDVWVARVAERLGVPLLSAVAVTSGDRVLGVRSLIDKAGALDRLDGPVVAVGDGMNDCLMVQRADVGVAYGGVHPPVASLLESADVAIYDPEQLCRFLREL
jgi:phosphoserine phosphatase